MNQCHFLGRLVADPQVKTVGADKKVVNFRIAVGRPYKRGTEVVKETAFLDMEAWDSGAELIEKYFVKGDPIIVHCAVKQDEWNDKTSNEKRSKLKFRVEKFEFVPGSKKEQASGSSQESVPDAGTHVDNGTGDIPF